MSAGGREPDAEPPGADLELSDLLEDTGTRTHLRRCPACFKPLDDVHDVRNHIATHDPPDFGLAPHGERE